MNVRIILPQFFAGAHLNAHMRQKLMFAMPDLAGRDIFETHTYSHAKCACVLAVAIVRTESGRRFL